MPHSEDGFIFEIESEIETSQRMNFGVCQTDTGKSLGSSYQFSSCHCFDILYKIMKNNNYVLASRRRDF